MAILADYLVITAARFKLEAGRKGSPRSSMSFPFALPPGSQFSAANPLLLHYTVTFVRSPGRTNQVKLHVSINGRALPTETFIEGLRSALVEVIVLPDTGGASLKLASGNTLRFHLRGPTSRLVRFPKDVLLFEKVILWFQRDSQAAG